MTETQMRITAGLGRTEDFPKLAEAGADEVYCGCVPYEWLQKYGAYFALNRREVLYYPVQIGSLDEMRILSRMSESYHVPIAVTFNSLYYLPEQYPMILSLMQRLCDMGLSRFIVADPALLFHIKESGLFCQIHLSGEAGELNLPALRFFRQFPIERWIFHRKISIPSMASLIKSLPTGQFEAFLLNERCHFTGAFCQSLHCDELPHLCKVPYQPIPRKEDSDLRIPDCSDNALPLESLGSTGCGLCAIKRLCAAGVTHLKIVGRGNHTDCTIRDIQAVKKALSIAAANVDEASFRKALVEEFFPQGCARQCYYP